MSCNTYFCENDSVSMQYQGYEAQSFIFYMLDVVYNVQL